MEEVAELFANEIPPAIYVRQKAFEAMIEKRAEADDTQRAGMP